jgi:hypothetical protein
MSGELAVIGDGDGLAILGDGILKVDNHHIGR